MSKKGIALETAVTLIMGAVFIIMVIYVLITTGLLSTFIERVNVFLCTASSLSRGTILAAIWNLWQWIIAFLIIYEIVAGFGSTSAGVGTAAKAGVYMKAALKAFAMFGAIAVIGMVSFSTIATMALINMIFPAIPLICPSTILDVGYDAPDSRAKLEEFYAVAGSRTLDCWDMMAQGKFDPLWGASRSSNPNTCFIVEAHLNGTVSLKDLYTETYYTFTDKWPFSDDKIYAYCGNKNAKGTEFSTWDSSECTFKDARIYIMYYDNHPEKLISGSEGSAACNVEDDWFVPDVFDQSHDSVVWCVEKLTTNYP